MIMMVSQTRHPSFVEQSQSSSQSPQRAMTKMMFMMSPSTPWTSRMPRSECRQSFTKLTKVLSVRKQKTLRVFCDPTKRGCRSGARCVLCTVERHLAFGQSPELGDGKRWVSLHH